MKAHASRVVEGLDGPHEAEVPFLYEILPCHAAPRNRLCNRHDKPQVRRNKAPARSLPVSPMFAKHTLGGRRIGGKARRGESSLPDATHQIDFLVGRQWIGFPGP